MSLAKYQQKRNFNKTPEPKGKAAKKTEQTFVVQKHAASHLHYDFRLAINGVLKSWAIPKGPCLDPSIKRLAVEVEDHPLAYATFEGEIPKGEYGGGHVIVWDYGTWAADDNLVKAYEQGSMSFSLQGEKLAGAWRLVKLAKPATKSQWPLIKVKDDYSQSLVEFDITEEKPNSVLSTKKLVTKSATEPKSNIKHNKSSKVLKNINTSLFKPELATLTGTMPVGQDWVYENKFDGYRILAFFDKDDVKLMSRNNLDWSHKFPIIQNELKKLKLSETILDGELVAYDKDNHSSFQLLQNYLNENKSQHQLHYFIFDMPFYEGKDLTSMPFIARKELLEKKIFKKSLTNIHYTEHFEGDAATILKAACEQGLEGIMAKHKKSFYQQKRTEDWLKLKCHKRQEFIVVGFTDPQGAREYFGSLLLAYYDENKKLIYAGHVGTGFNKQSLKMLADKLFKLEQTKMPLPKKPKDPLARHVHWVKPELIVEVSFTEWTSDNILRHPSYQGLRMDKLTKEIAKETPKNTKPVIKELTHPEKILYPNIKLTKLDLANYYKKVSELLLLYIQNRPISILRCPDGKLLKCFLQKHWSTGLPNVLDQVKIPDKETDAEYLTINNEQGLIGLAQLDVLEIHPWASRNDKLDYPDQIIFDLDPSETIRWQQLQEAAMILHETLDKLELQNFIKLTGGKGLHIVIPIKRTLPFIEAKQFTKLLAEKLAKYYPQLFTASISKQARHGKIFIDYLRNDKEATAIAPFSPRRDENASVAVTISWNKLFSYQNSKVYNINNIDNYFQDYPNNPWQDYFKLQQIINKRLYKVLEDL